MFMRTALPSGRRCVCQRPPGGAIRKESTNTEDEGIMQIECTKKLLDLLQKEALPYEEEADPFYCWTTGLITLNRRRTMIALNNATHCGFAVYGLTATVRKQLDQLLPKAIRLMMEQEQIPESWIGQYLNDCGENISYTRTRGRSAVGKLNRIGIEVQEIPEAYLEDGVLQPEISDWIDREFYRIDGKIFSAGEHLQQEFASRCGPGKSENPVMAVVNVRLRDTDCVRQLRVPGDCTLFRLHKIIQKSMCWQDEHEHMYGDADGLPMDLLFPEYLVRNGEDGFQADSLGLEWNVTVLEALQRVPRLIYLYDLGDSWTHEVTLVRVESDALEQPCQCLIATGDAPPEDVGGPDGLLEFRHIMQHPGNDEYETTRRWAIWQGWEPLNMDHINRRLNKM